MSSPPITVSWIRNLIRERWADWKLPGDPPRRISILQVAAGNWHVGQHRVTWLVFDGRHRGPVVVCKCNISVNHEPLRNEFETLKALFGRESEFGFVVPDPLALEEHAGGMVLIQRALEGSPLHAAKPPGGSKANQTSFGLETAGKFCLTLLRQSGEQARIDAVGHPHVEQMVRRLGEVRDMGGLSDWPDLTPDALTRSVAQVTLPHPWFAHGDLTSDHLFINGGALGVIDWEGFSKSGLPFGDLAQFLLTASQYFPSVDVPLVREALFGEEQGAGDPGHLGLIRQSIDLLRREVEGTVEDVRSWTALAVLDAVLKAKFAALKAGAREPDWNACLGDALAALKIGRETVLRT